MSRGILSIEKFLRNRELLKRKLTPKKRSRGKSQDYKITSPPNAQKKKRSKSLMRRTLLPEEIKILREETQKKIELMKNEKAPSVPRGNPFLSFKMPENTLFSNLEETHKKIELNKVAENPFLSIKKTEGGLFSSNLEASNKVVENPFLLKKTNNGFSENPFLSVKKTESPAAFGSLFPTDLSKNNLFANVSPFKKESETEAKNLFSGNNLFANSDFLKKKTKTFQKSFYLSDDFLKKGKFFLNSFESDITLKVEDQEFPAHKSILSERCKYFKAMFASGLSESHSAVIEITDTPASLFKAILRYVYLGMVDVNEELAIDFYDLAERYMIDELRVACEVYLASTLTLENCFKLFEMTEIYETPLLKKEVLLFFKRNLKILTERKDFEDLPKLIYIHIKKIQWDSQEIPFEIKESACKKVEHDNYRSAYMKMEPGHDRPGVLFNYLLNRDNKES